MSWKKEIEEIDKRRNFAKQQGGPEATKRHHLKGKLTARERIDAILDTNTFKELGAIAGSANIDENGVTKSYDPANYIVFFLHKSYIVYIV